MAQAEELLGDRRLTSGDTTWHDESRGPQQCTLSAERPDADGYDQSLTVTASRTAGSRELLLDLDRFMSDADTYTVSPIGNGWRGLLNTRATDPRASVVMPCDRDGQSPLVVNLRVRLPLEAVGPMTASQRVQLARLATETAANAARRADCQAPEGEPVRSVAAQVPTRFDDAPALAPGEATGTCANVEAPTWETAADPLAPVEDCLVLDRAGEPSFRLAAYYGPYVDEGGHVQTYKRGEDGVFRGRSGGAEGVYWTSASCPAQGGTAFFTAESLHGKAAPDPARQRAALRAFAERSAEAHGCKSPRRAQ
ncbi:hypothetical protein [Streptomyces sp. Da 82-17]|uniref:hypothetical protein n=1 Tax=Streptomyces sp. Da 82-17 TaxID=3377116 RepID=UPI0038D4E163